jgi:hypothetical protein
MASCSQILLNCLAFQSFDFESAGLFDVYVFISAHNTFLEYLHQVRSKSKEYNTFLEYLHQVRLKSKEYNTFLEYLHQVRSKSTN